MLCFTLLLDVNWPLNSLLFLFPFLPLVVEGVGAKGGALQKNERQR